MILVDTSVWIDYFRGTDRRLILHLQDLLDEDRVALSAPVRIEILAGSSPSKLPTLRRVLSALPTFLPSDSTWMQMESWLAKAVPRGERFGVADLLIAAIAAERKMSLWSRDRDFARMETLGFIRLYIPSC